MSQDNQPQGLQPISDAELKAMIITAQIGTQSQHDFIVLHMEEYFKRWPSYREKLTDLEWYHLFLDFLDKMEANRHTLSTERGEVPGWFKEWIEQQVKGFSLHGRHNYKSGAIAAYHKLSPPAAPEDNSPMEKKILKAIMQHVAVLHYDGKPESLARKIAKLLPAKPAGETFPRWVRANQRLPNPKEPILFKYSYPEYPIEKLAGALIDYGKERKYFVSGGLSFDKWEFLEWLEEAPTAIDK